MAVEEKATPSVPVVAEGQLTVTTGVTIAGAWNPLVTTDETSPASKPRMGSLPSDAIAYDRRVMEVGLVGSLMVQVKAVVLPLSFLTVTVVPLMFISVRIWKMP